MHFRRGLGGAAAVAGGPVLLGAGRASAASSNDAAATQAGGKAQNNPDPKYAAIVHATLPTIKGPADVVEPAITLEDVAARTYMASEPPELVMIPTDSAKLPPAAGSVGFPDAFYLAKSASPASEGAVQ